ncbi:MAG: hypothetical protein ABL986_08030 [Vicinamibacterales bacterium]
MTSQVVAALIAASGGLLGIWLKHLLRTRKGPSGSFVRVPTSKWLRRVPYAVVLLLTLGAFIYFERATGSSETKSHLAAPSIELPHAGETVGRSVTVSGTTPFLFMTHYVVVTSVSTGNRYVVGGGFRPGPGGRFVGAARFGEGEIGQGEAFALQVVSSERHLQEGLIDQLPNGAAVSPTVTVTRGL